MLEKTELPSREKPSPFTPEQMLDAGVVHLSAGRWKAFPAECRPLSQRQSLSESLLVSPASLCSVWLWRAAWGEGCAVLFPPLDSYAWSSGVCRYLWSDGCNITCCGFSAASSRGDLKWFNGEKQNKPQESLDHCMCPWALTTYWIKKARRNATEGKVTCFVLHTGRNGETCSIRCQQRRGKRLKQASSYCF